jgi:YVTN family beta-propeller protein
LWQIVLSSDGSRAFVASGGFALIYEVNLLTQSVTHTYSVGSSPHGLAMAPDGTTLYAANTGESTVSVINTVTQSFVSVHVGAAPFGITIGDVTPNAGDHTPPALSCETADQIWHSTDASIACTATDSDSGLANAGDAAFTLVTSVASGIETANAATGTRDVCDNADNCATAGPVAGNMVDKKAPSINVSVPSGGVHTLGSTVLASYSCSDAGSGVATCSGPVSNGTPIDTSAAGTKTFTVQAQDFVGNSASRTANYSVSYAVCLLYDTSRAYKSGSTIPIKIQLCDAASANYSSAATIVNAQNLSLASTTTSLEVVDAGNANPDNNFRYDSSLHGYIFNLKTTGLASGTYVMAVSASGDPVAHTISFQVR